MKSKKQRTKKKVFDQQIETSRGTVKEENISGVHFVTSHFHSGALKAPKETHKEEEIFECKHCVKAIDS